MKLTDPPLFRANPKRQEAQQFVASEPKLLFAVRQNLVESCSAVRSPRPAAICSFRSETSSASVPHFPLQLIAMLRLHLQGVEKLWRAASTCPAKPQMAQSC
jgi:hypothetical protein